jgi:hypothetical protein
LKTIGAIFFLNLRAAPLFGKIKNFAAFCVLHRKIEIVIKYDIILLLYIIILPLYNIFRQEPPEVNTAYSRRLPASETALIKSVKLTTADCLPTR